MHLGTIGDESGPGMIEHLETRATRNSRGQYIAKSNYPTSLALYDRNRRFVRTIGKQGNGPGEYQGIGAAVFGARDSLYLFDEVTHRFSVLDADFQFVQSGPLPVGPDLGSLVLPNGEFVFSTPVRTPAQIGQPLHRVGRDGKFIRSFGSESGLYRPDIPYFDRRAVALARTGMVWSAFRTQYVVELWNPVSGARISQIRRNVPWFPARMSPVLSRQEAREAPEPFLMALREDSNGVLWVLTAIPDPKWKSAVAPRRRGDAHVRLLEEQRYYDTMIEAFDGLTGDLLASLRVPQYLRQFVADDELGTVIEDDDGIPRLHLWRVSLTQK